MCTSIITQRWVLSRNASIRRHLQAVVESQKESPTPRGLFKSLEQFNRVAAVNVAGSTAPVIRSCTPLEKAISIVPPVPARAAHADGSGATDTAANCTSLSCRSALTAPNEPVRACRRQAVSRLGCRSFRRATSTTLAEAAWLSSTTRSFSIVDHRRCRSGPDRTETLPTFAHLIANQSANYRRQVAARKAALAAGLL